MNNTIQISSSDITINGQSFPLKVGTQLVTQCRLAADLKRSSNARRNTQSAWQTWCDSHQWSPEESPAGLLEANDNAVALYSQYLECLNSHKRDQRQWAQLMSDSVFLLIYEADMNAEKLDALADEMSSVIPMSSRQLIESVAHSEQEQDSQTAKQLLRFGRILSVYGLLLNWPSPPFNAHFFQQLEMDFDFQLRWQNQVLLELSVLPKTVRNALHLPNWPETPEGIAEWLNELQAVKKSSFILSMRNGLSDDDLCQKHFFDRWTLIWDRTNHDMATVLALMAMTSDHRSAEALTDFLFKALSKELAAGESVVGRVRRHQEQWSEIRRFKQTLEDQQRAHQKTLSLSLKESSAALFSLPIIVYTCFELGVLKPTAIGMIEVLALPLIIFIYVMLKTGGINAALNRFFNRVSWWFKSRKF
ncbi:MAG: hypothetical protein ACON4U_09490 [Myxococcota bacterium]